MQTFVPLSRVFHFDVHLYLGTLMQLGLFFTWVTFFISGTHSRIGMSSYFHVVMLTGVVSISVLHFVKGKTSQFTDVTLSQTYKNTNKNNSQRNKISKLHIPR